jgi:hypothetical protein
MIGERGDGGDGSGELVTRSGLGMRDTVARIRRVLKNDGVV